MELLSEGDAPAAAAVLVRYFSNLDGPIADAVELPLPLEVPIVGGIAVLSEGRRDGDYRLVLEKKVNPTGLSLRSKTGVQRPGPDGTYVDAPQVEVAPGSVESGESADDIAAVLSFLTDEFFAVSVLVGEDELVPETKEDEALLDLFGTREIWQPLSANAQIRTFREPITPELVASLLSKRVGVQLYAEAIRHTAASARYRDLWRVLESAFGLKDDDLIRAAAAYKPAQELGFTEKELRDLHRLRGRASHAESRAGIRELRLVRAKVAEREGRLKSLIERVLVTKRDWGSRSSVVVELGRLRGWVG